LVTPPVKPAAAAVASPVASQVASPSSPAAPRPVTIAINEMIANRLLLIATYYDLEPGTPNATYKASVYRTASDRIRVLPTALRSGAEARQIPGIGPSISTDIQSLLTTGRIPRLVELEERHIEEKVTLDLFQEVHGIGIKSAIKYYGMGFRTIEELLQSAPLTHAQRLAATYYDELRLRIPRQEIDVYRETIASILPSSIRWMIVGSYRRGESSSGDIDILVESQPGLDLRRVGELLDEAGMVIGFLASGRYKSFLIVRLPNLPARRLDLQVIPRENWAFSLLYFTGSVTFNTLLRSRAAEFGLKLNEFRLLNLETGETYPAETEEDILQLLQVRYYAPEERTRNLTEL